MDLWTEASVDVEAELAREALTRAKVAVASLWPFLAMAASTGEFEHRLALASDSIADRVPVEQFDTVVASLREDFAKVAAEEESDEDDEGDDGKPDWLKEKIGSRDDAPSRGEAQRDAELDEEDRRNGVAPPPRPEYSVPDPWQKQSSHQVTAFYDEQSGRWVKVATDDDQNAGAGNPAYFVGGPEAGPNTGQTNQYPTFPVGNAGDPWNPMNGQFPMQPSAWAVPPGGEWKESPMNFNPPGGPNATQASRLPFAEAAGEVGETAKCANCGSGIKRVKVSWGSGASWTHTGEHGLAGDDDHPPYPRKQAAANPHYFDGGSEGIAGDQQSGFPADVTLPEDEEDRASTLYGQTPISGGYVDNGNRVGSRHTATEENPAPDSERNLGTDFDSSQERERFERMREGQQPGSRDSTSMTGSLHQGAFYDPSDPGVQTVAFMGGGFGDDNPFAPGSSPTDGASNVPQGQDADASTQQMKKGPGGGKLEGGIGEAFGGDPFGAIKDIGRGIKDIFTGGGDGPGDASDGASKQDRRMMMAFRQVWAAEEAGTIGMEPPTPPAMVPGQPGSVSQGPMAPSTTKPRQMPGGGGAADMAMATRHTADSENRGRPTFSNPYGTDDPFDATTWDNATNQRPMMSMEHMHFNGPQNPNARGHIETVHSDPNQRREEDED
jgi:hypothetical protein